MENVPLQIVCYVMPDLLLLHRHHCLKTGSKKLEKLHERALKYIYRDLSLDYRAVTDRTVSYTLADRRLQDMLIIIYKALNNRLPVYIENMFRVRINIKNLRGMNKLVLSDSLTSRQQSNHDFVEVL